MADISSMMLVKEEIIAVTAIVLGLSWIATKKWVPDNEWRLANMAKWNKKGLRQWILAITGIAFFIGTPIVIMGLLYIVSQETNAWAVMIIISLIIIEVALTRIIRESSVKRIKGK